MKRLQRDGIIQSHTANLDRRISGCIQSAFVHFTLSSQGHETIEAFEAEVVKCTNIIECHLMTGDYGTGQSTMSYLQRLPADKIKIAQSFVKTITENESNQVLVKSAIEMAHALGFKVVAEGIEDQSCFEMLKKSQ